MSDVEKLKRSHSATKSRVTKYGNNLKQSISDNQTLETIDVLYSDFVCAWKNLEDKHDAYVSTTSDDQITENEGWFGEVQKRFNEIRFLYLGHKKNVEIGNEICKAQHYRDICESNFNELCENIEKSIKHKFQNETIIRERDLLSKFYDEIQSVHKQLCVIGGQDGKELLMWHANVFRKLEYINKNVDEYLKTPRQEKCYEKDSARRKFPFRHLMEIFDIIHVSEETLAINGPS